MFRGKYLDALKKYHDSGKLIFTGNCLSLRNHYNWQEFIRLFLTHVLPKGFHRVRFSGFLSNCRKTKNLKHIHRLRGTVYAGNPVKGKGIADIMLLLYDINICKFLQLPDVK